MSEVRTTRAYIAGFGTAGSLLAGAAVVFVLASAVVSFQGWPQLENHPSAPALVRAGTHASVDLTGPRRIAAVLAAQHVPTGAAGRVSGGAVARTPVSPAPTSSSVSTAGGPQISVLAGSRPSITPLAPAGPRPGCASACGGGPSAGGLAGTVQQTTGALGGTVAGAGASLGSTVNGVANALGGAVNGVSSSLAGTVRQAGQVLGGTVSGATGAAGSTLAGAGQVVGTLLGGH